MVDNLRQYEDDNDMAKPFFGNQTTMISFQDKFIEKYAKAVSEIFLKKITKTLPQYIFWKDQHSVYLGCNDNYALLHGLITPEDIIGLTDDDLNWQQSGVTADTFKQDDQTVMQGHPIVNKEEILILPNGKKIDTLVSKRPIIDDEENILGVVGYFVDITERKQLERIEIEKALAEEKADFVKMLAGSIAHELRTPIAGALAANTGIGKVLPHLLEVYELALAHNLVEDPMRRVRFSALQNALASQSRLLRHCHHIIDMQLKNINLSSINNDGFSWIDPQIYIQQAIDEYPLTPDEKALVQLNVDDQQSIFIDPVLLKHIIWNLLKNALYYIKAANKGNISIWSEALGEQLVIYFKDTGKGMPKDIAACVFDSFYTKRRGGTGLGLSFCQAVMSAANGSITCDSNEGEHTTFTLYFPLALA